MIANTPEDICE